MKRIYLIILLLCAYQLQAQNLLTSSKSSFFSYIFKITDEEAKQIYLKGGDIINESFLNQLVDSCPSYTDYDKRLDAGHYIRATVFENKIEYEISVVPNCQVITGGNGTNLFVHAFDLNGKTLSDVEVRLNSNKLRFNDELQCFRDKNWNTDGLLSVTHQGQTFYFPIDRRTKYNRFWNTFLYGTPVKYVWRPVNFVLRLPVDSYKSIRYGHPRGTIWKIGHFFSQAFYRVACLFDDYYCDDIDRKYNPYTEEKGYVITNKPKYQIGDTLKIKAFIANGKGEVLNEEIEVRFSYGNGKKIERELKPYYPGAFKYELVLSDSLNLKLDKPIFIYLRSKRGSSLLNHSVLIEDYELKRSSFELEVPNKTHYHGVPFYIFAEGKDDNELTLPDARIKLKLIPKAVTKHFEDTQFLKNIVWEHTQNLLPDGKTKILIPDSIFPKLNLTYQLQTTLLTSDNERMERKVDVTYYYKENHLHYELKQDSIELWYTENGIRTNKKMQVLEYDKKDRVINVTDTEAPTTIKINPFTYEYSFRAEGTKNELLEIGRKDHRFSCYTWRMGKQIHLKVNNPRNLKFNYILYKGNREIAKGSAAELDTTFRARPKSNYSLSVHFLWAGEFKHLEYALNRNTKQLQVKIDQPERIVPGQEVELGVEVTDYTGKPVPNVDVSFFGLTSKFNYQAPYVPDFSNVGRKSAGRKSINYLNRNRKSIHDKEYTQQLNFPFWNMMTKLDSIEFFKFRYPQKGVYQTEIVGQKDRAQFAPFVMKDGEPETVYVIEINHRPVYFAWNTVEQPYSVPIQSIKDVRYITLRTAKRRYEINNFDSLSKNTIVPLLHFEKGKKTIFSIDSEIRHERINVVELDNKLTDHEQRNYYRYIFPYHQPQYKSPALVEQNELLFELKKTSRSNYKVNLSGPIDGGGVRFSQLDEFETDFFHEPYYSYTFDKGLLKMKSVQKENLYPKWLSLKPKTHLTDLTISKKQIETDWKKQKEKRVESYRAYGNPTATRKGNGRLILSIPPKEELPEYWILKTYTGDSLARVYGGKTVILHDLSPQPYKLIALFKDNKFAQYDSVEVQADGRNYFRLISFDKQKVDSVKLSLNYFVPLKYKPVTPVGYTPPNKSRHFQRFATGLTVRGVVIDEDSGEPLPGANVIVQGTTIGTISNFDGEWELDLPSDIGHIVFGFLGYKNEEIEVNAGGYYTVSLSADRQALEEVIVIGYGVQKKSVLTGAITSQVGNALMGKAAGVQVTDKNYLTLHQEGIKAQASKALPFPSSDESAMRSNFLDDAFWQPALLTDAEGKATCRVKFPDDVTNWSTFALAMNDQKQSGQSQGHIQAYKSVMAQLYTPRFLVSGDSCLALGKSVNYSEDTFPIKTSLKLGDEELVNKSHRLAKAVLDSVWLKAPESDTCNISFKLETENGYFDGERRKIPVFPIGTQENIGKFVPLWGDTSLQLTLGDGETLFRFEANPLDVVWEETKHIGRYGYLCNEQLASKIRALLFEEEILAAQKKPFKHRKKVQRMIKRLESRAEESGLWGWWQNSAPSMWISLHVFETLNMARQKGYQVAAIRKETKEKLVWQYSESDASRKLRIMECMAETNMPFNYATELDTLWKSKLDFQQKLKVIRLQQKTANPYDLDFILKSKQSTLWGNLFWGDKRKHWYMHENTLQTTAAVYDILKNDSTHRIDLRRLIGYFFEMRRENSWRNTYESATILTRILPDLLFEKKNEKLKVEISGAQNQTIDSFPALVSVEKQGKIDIRKTGNTPVFFSWHQTRFEPEPAKVDTGNFVISTSLWQNKEAVDSLIAGEPATILVDLQVKKKCDYVMIEVPIPAGCSYGTKFQSWRNEVHREYFKEKTSIFCRQLDAGSYTFSIQLLPRYTGKYTMNPARAELMYFPIFFGRNEVKKIDIE